MKLQILRDPSGQVVSTVDTTEVRTPDGSVTVEAEPEDGQEFDSVEVLRRETFDVDGLHQRLAQKK